MSRRAIGIWTLIIMMLGTFILCGPVAGYLAEKGRREAFLTQLEERTEALEESERIRYRNIAKWYNTYLAEGEYGCVRNYYGTILNLYDGAMGWLAVPELEMKIPIFCEGAGREGYFQLEHDAETPLPIGGRGNHTILTCGDVPVLLEEKIRMFQTGDLIEIHILGDTLLYRVGRIGESHRHLEETADECTLIFRERSGGRIQLHCSRTTESREQMPPNGVRIWTIAGMAFAAALTLPCFGWLLGRILRGKERGNRKAVQESCE